MRRLVVPLAAWWRALAGSASVAAVALGLLACLCTLLAVAGPRAAAQLRTTAFRQFIAGAPALDKDVVGSVGDSVLGIGRPQGLTAGQIQLAGAELRRNLRGLPLAGAAADWNSLTTPLLAVTDTAPAVRAVLPPKLELSYRNTLAANVRVVAGRLPGGHPGSGATTILQAAVTEATARRFGLDVGSRLVLPGTGLELAVTGIVQPRDPAAPFWTADRTVATPVLEDATSVKPFWIGGAFIGAGAVGALQTRINISGTKVTFTFPLELGNLTSAQARALQPALAGALSTAGQITVGPAIPVSITLSSGVGQIIGEFAAGAASAGSVLDLLSISLAVLGAVLVLLAAWLLAQQRRQDFALLRARGAARRQLALQILATSAVVVVPGAAAGAATAVALTPAAPNPLSWWLAGLGVLASLAGPVLFTVRLHRGYAAPTRPDRPAGRLSSARRMVVEGALLLGAVGGLLVLRHQGTASGSPGAYPSAAPALLAIVVAVVVLRVYPLMVRGLLRVASRRAGPVAFLGLARAARVSASAILPAFAMVLALALVSFAGMVRGAVTRGEVAASWQQAGADAVISGTGPVSPALQQAVAAVPGVQHSAAVAIGAGELGSGQQFAVVFVDPARYAALIAATPLPSAPSRFVAAAGGRHPSGPVPALASPALAAQLGRAPVSVQVSGQRAEVRVVGQAAAMSAITGIGGGAGYLVLDRRVAGSAAGPPNALLVVGPALSRPRLAAAVRRYGPGASIVFRSRLLAGLAAAPLRHGAYLALALGGVAAAICSLLVLLLSLLLSAQSRQRSLARMSTMGLSAAQGRLLALTETLPLLLAVLVGGAASAAALGPLIGPALSLASLTGSASGVPVLIEPAWLGATAAGLLALTIATLTGQTSVASRSAARSFQMEG